MATGRRDPAALKAALSRAAAGTPAPEAATPATPEVRKSAPPQLRNSAATHVRTDPVRVTVELQPLEHRGLKRASLDLAEDIGVPDVAGAEIFRALLSVLRDTDPAEPVFLHREVATRLTQSGGDRRRKRTD